MITDRHARGSSGAGVAASAAVLARPRAARLLRWFALAALVLAGWAAIMALMPFIGSGREVAVVGDAAAAVRTIRAANGSVVEVRRGAVIARGEPGFVRALYAAGAPLVIEGRIAAGCFPAKAGA